MIYVCCLAHIRRKFHDALQPHPGDAYARAVVDWQATKASATD